MAFRKVIEMIIDSENEEDWGVHAISVVKSPAIEKDFLLFSKDKQEVNAIKLMSEEKRIVVGPILIPDKEIYRHDEQEGEYYIKFSKDTVRRASELYLQRSFQANVTEEHNAMVQGITLTESWIVEGAIDKAAHLGFKVPKGTWMGTMKVMNDEIWEKVKNKDLKGFSIEGMFAPKMSSDVEMMAKVEEAAREVLGI